MADVKELIPQWYSDAQFLINRHRFRFGATQQGKPPQASFLFYSATAHRFNFLFRLFRLHLLLTRVVIRHRRRFRFVAAVGAQRSEIVCQTSPRGAGVAARVTAPASLARSVGRKTRDVCFKNKNKIRTRTRVLSSAMFL
jgi:hypothetical protein